MTKGPSSFGGNSTIRTRQAIRSAVADSDVHGIMIPVDSPGGTVAGTAGKYLQGKDDAIVDLSDSQGHGRLHGKAI